MLKNDNVEKVETGGNFCRCKERRALERLEQRVAELEQLIRKGEPEIECTCKDDAKEDEGAGVVNGRQSEASVDEVYLIENFSGKPKESEIAMDQAYYMGAAEQDEEGMPGQEETDAEVQAALEKAAKEEEEKQEALRVLQEVQFLLQHCNVNEILQKLGKVTDLEEMNEKLKELINQVSREAIFNEDDVKRLENHVAQLVDLKLFEVSKQIDGMKRIQEALEYLEDLLALKANSSEVANFVTTNLFDAACDDLTKGIDHCFDAINFQGVEWQKSLVDVKTLLDEKLDRCEMKALKEFLHKKLTDVMRRLRQLEKLQEEIACAATRPKILRDLKCIVCDAAVVMPTETAPATCTKLPAMSRKFIRTPGESVAPCYSPKKGLKIKDSNGIFDSIEIASVSLDEEADRGTKSLSRIRHQLTHICKRYCGGAHTVTIPQERIVRKGNFYVDFNIKTFDPTIHTSYRKLSKTGSLTSVYK